MDANRLPGRPRLFVSWMLALFAVRSTTATAPARLSHSHENLTDALIPCPARDRSRRPHEALRRKAGGRRPELRRPPGIVTGFLGPNGAGKSHHDAVDPRPRPARPRATSPSTAGATRPPGAAARGRRPAGGARVHTGRTACNHLLALAQTHGIPRTRVDEVIDLVGLHDVARKRGPAASRSAWASGSASPPRCSATRPR